MLDDAGSIASLAGLAVSLGGLAIAIWQIKKLRGETRAANEAAAETRRALQRENAGINLARVSERIEGLMELHRRGEWGRALDRSSDIRRLLIDIASGHPEISEEQQAVLFQVVERLTRIGHAIEDSGGALDSSDAARFNRALAEDQNSLAQIGSQLQQGT